MKEFTTRKKVENVLKMYAEIKASINLIKDNIELLETELERVYNGEESIFKKDIHIYNPGKIIDKIRISEVEKEVLIKEKNICADSEYIKRLIEKEKYNLNQKKEIIKTINAALRTLTNRQNWIIKAWYFDNTKYSYIEMLENYNKIFNTNITNQDTIRSMKCIAITKLDKILSKNKRILYMI